MSAYNDFVIDLPKRCIELLKSMEPRARVQGREVSLLLMASSMAFVVPYERLNKRHPARDAEKFSKVVEFLDGSLNAQFGSGVFSPPNAQEWKGGKVTEFGGGPDSWVREASSVASQPTSYVLAIVRNALAHANLFTRGDPINQIVFFAECRTKSPTNAVEGFKFLFVPVAEYRAFLLNWFEMLEKQQIPYREILEEIERAA